MERKDDPDDWQEDAYAVFVSRLTRLEANLARAQDGYGAIQAGRSKRAARWVKEMDAAPQKARDFFKMRCVREEEGAFWATVALALRVDLLALVVGTTFSAAAAQIERRATARYARALAESAVAHQIQEKVKAQEMRPVRLAHAKRAVEKHKNKLIVFLGQNKSLVVEHVRRTTSAARASCALN